MLKEFAYLEEEHHEYRLGELRFGTWQEAYQEGAHCSHAHQEVLVEHLAMHYSLHGLADGVVADQEKRHEIYEQQLPHFEVQSLFDDYRADEQNRRQYDAQEFFLFHTLYVLCCQRNAGQMFVGGTCSKVKSRRSSVRFAMQRYSGFFAIRLQMSPMQLESPGLSDILVI